MLIGVGISLLLTIAGGAFDLFLHGDNIVSYQVFHAQPQSLDSPSAIIKGVFSFTPAAIIQLGLLILVLLQSVRIALMTGFFIKLQDNYFIWISLFILAVLIYSCLFGTSHYTAFNELY